MNLLMISGDRSILTRKKGAFWHTLQEMRKHWERIDIICPRADAGSPAPSEEPYQMEISSPEGRSVYFHPNPKGLLTQSRWIVKKGKELISEHHHDVMTVHEYPPFYNGMGAKRLAKATDIPYALEIHHIVGHPKPASFSERIGKILSRWYLARDARTAKAVRVVNRTVKRILVSWGVPLLF